VIQDRYGSRLTTERERSIIKLVAEGWKNGEIGAMIGLSENVVKNYLRIIYDKLGLWNRVELTIWYLEHESEMK
jgi:DNA-binding NarL/FixJ family response regulator